MYFPSDVTQVLVYMNAILVRQQRSDSNDDNGESDSDNGYDGYINK